MWLDIFCDPVMRQRQVCFFPFFFFGSFKKLKYTLFVLFTRLKFCATFLSLRACVCVSECVITFIFDPEPSFHSSFARASSGIYIYFSKHTPNKSTNKTNYKWPFVPMNETKQSKMKRNETKHYEGEILWITQFVLKLYALCCRDILSCMLT